MWNRRRETVRESVCGGTCICMSVSTYTGRSVCVCVFVDMYVCVYECVSEMGSSAGV